MKLLGFTILSQAEIDQIKETSEELMTYLSSGKVSMAPSELFHLAANLDWELRNTLGYTVDDTPNVKEIEDGQKKAGNEGKP